MEYYYIYHKESGLLLVKTKSKEILKIFNPVIVDVQVVHL